MGFSPYGTFQTARTDVCPIPSNLRLVGGLGACGASVVVERVDAGSWFVEIVKLFPSPLCPFLMKVFMSKSQPADTDIDRYTWAAWSLTWLVWSQHGMWSKDWGFLEQQKASQLWPFPFHRCSRLCWQVLNKLKQNCKYQWRITKKLS